MVICISTMHQMRNFRFILIKNTYIWADINPFMNAVHNIYYWFNISLSFCKTCFLPLDFWLRATSFNFDSYCQAFWVDETNCFYKIYFFNWTQFRSMKITFETFNQIYHVDGRENILNAHPQRIFSMFPVCFR